MTEYETAIWRVLKEIDSRITESIRTEELARTANYSVYHFRRVFQKMTGMSVMSYITRRKMEYALYDLACGQQIIDVAVAYGFETHTGFTKAFKKCFGYPPSFYRLHVAASEPGEVRMGTLPFGAPKKRNGGIRMQVQIKEIDPLCAAGYTSRHRMPGVSRVSDIPGYWEKINMDYAPALSTLHHTYQKSRHCEVAICFDLDDENECFTYMLGVGVDPADAGIPQRPGSYLRTLQGGLYAVFTTPLVEDAAYVSAIRDTWKEAADWLSRSAYVYDSSREEYEYYDERDHGEQVQMEIRVPVCCRNG